MRILFLDDDKIRHKKFAELGTSHTTIHAMTAQDAMAALAAGPFFDVVYLDHDLNAYESKSTHRGLYGESRETTGYDVAQWIVQELPLALWPGKIVVHSHNPRGAAMRDLLSHAGIPTTWELFKS